jgi:hypothetical protein
MTPPYEAFPPPFVQSAGRPASLRAKKLFQRADELDQLLDLVVSEFAIVSRHLVFAFFDKVKELSVRLFGDFRIVKILYTQFLRNRGVTFAIRSMADLAL